MNRMRVLYMATEFPPACGYGLGRYGFEHCRALAQAGLDVEVICNNYHATTDTYRIEGFTVSNTPYMVPFKCYQPIGDVLHSNPTMLARAAQKLTTTGDFQVIQAHDWLAASAVAALQDTYHIPVVVTMHDTQLGKSLGRLDGTGAYIMEMERWICQRADAICTNSDFLREELVVGYGPR